MLKVASVFSGIGSFEHSLIKNNIKHKVIFACDIDKYCKINYLNNYNTKDFYNDIKDIDGTKYKNKLDLLVAGCPCQSWSISGLRKGFNDTRGLLIHDCIKLIKESQPKIFIFENVKGLLNYDNGKVFEFIIKQFKKCGYDVEYKIISSKKINFPQSRERIFIIGHRKDLNNEFIFDKIKDIKLTDNMCNYLDDLNDIDEKYYITNHKWQKLICNQQQLDKQKIKINGCGKTTDPTSSTFGDYILCQTARQYGNFVIEYKEKSNFNYCEEALDCIKRNKIIPLNYPYEYNFKHIIKNSILRRLTPNECLKLMGFKNFDNVCSDFQIYKQCGNSIIVNMFDVILEKLSL